MLRIEDYGLIGDMRSAALVGRNGSLDWLCLPRFDSASCFAALLGDAGHGRWLIAPNGQEVATSRRYRPGTLVLESDFETPDGVVRVIDFMPRRGDGPPRVMRIVECLSGSVSMHMELVLRPDYGSIVPWVELAPDGAVATAGPDAFRLVTIVPLAVENGTIRADFTLTAGMRARFALSWHVSFEEAPSAEDADSALARTEAWWREWSGRCTYDGAYRDEVLTSLIALKAMTSETTGGVVAAPTTSLPEDIGSVRNWDYRYCWLRDAVLTLEALLAAGYTDELMAFRQFVLRVATGDPAAIQIMYGIGGERRLTEFELPDLHGYEGSRPVRVGNAASEQFQLDVFGEVVAVAFIGSELLNGIEERLWPRWQRLVEYVESIWREPDDGIWESRGGRKHFTYSKVMAWVALDRAVRIADLDGREGALDLWRANRDELRELIEREGVHTESGAFLQSFGDSGKLDASNLMIPIVGFVSHDDPRARATFERTIAELSADGFVYRYVTDGVDGLAGEEATFAICSFWLVECLARAGEAERARELFERLLGFCNDVGLLAEEIDPHSGELIGNFPQAFSHVGLIQAAIALDLPQESMSMMAPHATTASVD
jgi:GH15 family glucan-1,4-alpha-glucosidase